MKDKTKQTEIQAHILQKSSIIVERFPVFYCYNIAHAQTRHFSGSCSDIIDSRNRSVFFLLQTYKPTLCCSILGFTISTVLNEVRSGFTISNMHYVRTTQVFDVHPQ